MATSLEHLQTFVRMFEQLEYMGGPGYDPDGWSEAEKAAREYVYGLAFHL